MPDQRELRCLIAAGGTVGHVAPALAVAEALRERGVTVTFAGSPDRVEARLVPERGYPFDAFAVAGFPRRPGPSLVRSLALAAAAPLACLRILERRRPDVVLGGGGYVAGPMVLAARLRGIPTALSEADAHLGLANRLAAPFAQRVFLALPVRSGAKYEPVGRPVPMRSRAAPRASARAELGLPAEGPVVLVFGGSLGARLLNELAIEAWGAEGPAVLHLCGERDHASLRERVSRPDYVLKPFVDEIGLAYGAADVALARAGGSVWELAAAGLPAVLVPGEFATGGHQEKNAAWFARTGGAIVVPEAEAARAPGVVAGLLALFQPHLYSRTRYLAHEFAVALAGADAVCVTEIYPAREEPLPGVSGRLIVDELARVRPGMRIGWAVTLEDAARIVSAWARPGDTILTLGAGDVDRAAELLA